MSAQLATTARPGLRLPDRAVRPMVDADVDQCLGVWSDAFAESRRRLNRPALVVSGDARERECRRVRHLLHTDPDGSWVATSGDRLIGLAQSICREGLWVLSLLSVAVDAQGAGVGRALLEVALGSRPRAAPGLVLSSPEPRAASLYARAGFRPAPMMSAIGPMLVAAGDTDAARDLLRAALLVADGPVAVHGLTAAQTWALPVMVAAGLELRPGGALMVAGAPGPLVPYVPSGPFG